MMSAYRLMLVLFAVLWSTSASAQNTRKLCFLIPEDYIDESPHSDYHKWNANRRIRGVRVRVQEGVNTLFDDFAPWTGSDRGCIVTPVHKTNAHTITVFTTAKVDGRLANVSNGTFAISHVETGYFAFHGDTDFLVDWDEGWPEIDISTWMLYRDDMGIPTSDSIEFRTGDCCYFDGSGSGKIYTDFFHTGSPPPPDPRKFTIAHEVGHHVGWVADGEDPALVDYEAPWNGCNGAPHAPLDFHHYFQKEYSSAAMVEGWANFMAAWTFNHRAGDCILAPERVRKQS